MGRGVRRLSGKEAGDTAGNSMAGKSARVTSSQRVASVAQQQLVLGNSPSLQKRCMGTQLEVFTPGVNKGVNARPSVTSRKAHTPTILSYVNKRPRGRLSVVDLTPSPKANTPASKRLILEQFFSKKAKAGNATEQKRLDDLLDDPLGRRMANTMHTSAEEGASKEASRSKNKHTRIAFKADMENFFSVAARVHASDVPDEIIGREYEKKYMEEFWNRHVLGGVGASLCITGCPGSGKTALLSHFIRCKLSGDNNSSYPIRMLQLNSMSLPDPSRLLSVLLARLSRRKFSGKLLEEIALKSMLIPPCASVRRKLPMYIITLDEIDHMAHRNAKDIYRLFEWTAAPNSRLVFIGISNTLNFIDKHMPLLKSMDCAPNSLNFKPYSVPEIRDVVASRLAQKSPSSLNIHPSALELIARKASSTGDLRKALALCRSALRIAAQSDSPSTQLSLENALAASRVPSHQKKSALITSLTLQQKTVLTALAKEKRDTPLISLFITYRSLCTQLTSGISQVSRSEFSDIVAFLESLGIVNLYSKSRQLSSSSNLSTDWLSTLVAPCFSPNDLPIPL